MMAASKPTSRLS